MSSEYFEEELLAVTTQHRDGAGGKVQFRLKEDQYLQWFEPYYYLIPETQAKQQEVLQSSIFSEKKLINEVLGDYTGAYKYTTGVN